MDEKQTTYPMHVNLMLHITNGESVGTVTYGHGMHKLPTEQQMPDILDKVLSQLPDGYRLMDRAESSMFYMREERGYRGPNLIVPSLGVWFDPATDKEFTTLNDEPEMDEYEE